MIASLLLVAAVPVGAILLQRWRHGRSRRSRNDSRLNHSTSIQPESRPSAVRVLRSDEDVASARERANASAARVAAARASRRYGRTLTG
jgi:hypothetical protein